MSDESPYRPIQITAPDGHPLTNTADFTDIIAEFYANLSLVKPIEPIKLTQEQLDAVRAASEPALPGAAPPLLSTPIIIVERIEDSTPYQRRREELKRAAEASMTIPYPTYTDTFFDPSLIRDNRRKR